jgi:predicted nucleotidyltransferase
VTTPTEAFATLQDAERSGELARLAERLSLALVVVFGSAARGEAAPRDLDVAVSSRPGTRLDILDVVNALIDLTGFDDVDVMDLDRADALARQHALVPGEPLYEFEPGGFAREQLRASAERLSTEWMRRADLALLAGGDPP